MNQQNIIFVGGAGNLYELLRTVHGLLLQDVGLEEESPMVEEEMVQGSHPELQQASYHMLLIPLTLIIPTSMGDSLWSTGQSESSLQSLCFSVSGNREAAKTCDHSEATTTAS